MGFTRPANSGQIRPPGDSMVLEPVLFNWLLKLNCHRRRGALRAADASVAVVIQIQA